jgi:hypothetical protein
MNGGHHHHAHAHHDYDNLYGPIYGGGGGGRHSSSPAAQPSGAELADAQQQLATLTAFSASSIAANSPMDYSVAGEEKK